MSTIEECYDIAREQYAAHGVDTEAVLSALKQISISIHCWQVDDVAGFEQKAHASSGGGIQATGNYPGRATTISEARQDYEKVLSLLPGKHRLNLHASYGEFNHPVERDAIGPEHFQGWIDWAKTQDVALDFNSTCFAHEKADSGFTLSSKDAGIRDYWIEHVKRCREIGHEMGSAQGDVCIHNVWIPDGAKDITVDRMGHRALLTQSLDACFEQDFDALTMKDAVESKLFGIGSEYFVVGSHEFYLGYTITRNKLLCLDLGHFHPTESVDDKLSSILQYTDELLLHVSRPIRWDSDHVVILDDRTRDLCAEIVRCSKGKKFYIALDFFDASINRIGAYVTGVRATQQALLLGLLNPYDKLLALEESGDYFQRLALLEGVKALPFGAVWDQFCLECDVPAGTDWIAEVKGYESQVVSKR